MNFRQVHLDFHTSENIGGIGEKFNKSEFQEALRLGHVDSVTLTAKCHHGYSYYLTKANEMHPGLKFDLLAAELSAAREIGVKTPVYLSAGIDLKATRVHPEWLIRDKNGKTTCRICMGTPYLERLCAEVEEVCASYDCDGMPWHDG